MTCRTWSDYMAGIFPGKVRKIAVNAGLGCPNRDGTKGSGGCIYCNNLSFNPAYAATGGGSIDAQLARGIEFSRHKGDVYGYLAYFQSYTNTYGDIDRLTALYDEALRHPGVVGLVIATRPDCLPEELMDRLQAMEPYVMVEIGVESTLDSTLKRINRGHDFQCAQRAILELDRRGIDVGAHLILGLPGETHADFMEHARRMSQLPVKTLKLHQLQVIKGTPLARMYSEDESSVRLFTAQEYAATVTEFISRCRPDIAFDRFVSETPPDMLIAPRWNIKPAEFAKLL
ncbi:MAG: TIGR01212 family radical SAM protein [Bacteroidaceae bacterium]|nr:TIGR01212 family radical SAM protein [Bacteroidaceae bacterium]